jgi:hypothetical protein
MFARHLFFSFLLSLLLLLTDKRAEIETGDGGESKSPTLVQNANLIIFFRQTSNGITVLTSTVLTHSLAVITRTPYLFLVFRTVFALFYN